MKTRKSRPGVVKALRAIRDNVNEELTGKSFVEQQRYVREQLKRANASVSHRQHPGRRSA